MSLRAQVLKGGVFMVVRFAVGLVISLGGMLLLTRLIGPVNYGLYVGSFAIVTFLGEVGRVGVDVYLLRREQEADAETYHQARTLLLASGLIVVGTVSLALPAVGAWYGDPRFLAPLQTLIPAVCLTLLAVPALAKLEWNLNYAAVTGLELVSQCLYYVIALSLAFAGWGVWAPVTGWYASQTCVLIGSHVVLRSWPRLSWSTSLVREILGYGLGYSASVWIWQLRTLVNPLVVGRFIGPEGVAYVGLAIRLVETLTFVKGITWRLSVAAFGKVQGDYGRLRRAMEEAMGLQVLAAGPFLAAFASIGSLLVPMLFGARWSAALVVFPFVALSYLVNAVFNMHSSVLYVFKHNRAVATFHIAHVALFAGASLVLVPRLGLVGYGWAEVVALLGYLVIHACVRTLFAYSYTQALPWFLGIAPALFAVYLPFPWWTALWVPAILAAFWPRQRRQLGEYIGYLRWRTA